MKKIKIVEQNGFGLSIEYRGKNSIVLKVWSYLTSAEIDNNVIRI